MGLKSETKMYHFISGLFEFVDWVCINCVSSSDKAAEPRSQMSIMLKRQKGI